MRKISRRFLVIWLLPKGALIGILKGYSSEKLLLAEAAAVASLTASDATSGILEEKLLLENIGKFTR
jgi:hypothetical protein